MKKRVCSTMAFLVAYFLCLTITINSALAGPGDTAKKVTLTEKTILVDMDCFEVSNNLGSFVLGKKGAGFASIFDSEKNDWISYKHGDKAKGEYRGMPKCGQPTKFFHCGYGYHQYKTENIFTSKITVQKDDHIRIECETKDGKTAGSYDFYSNHVTFTISKIALETHWFLYEGTPGGKLESDKDFIIRPDGKKTTLDQPWSEVVPWACIGASETKTGFICLSHQKPEADQTDSYVSWPFEKGMDGQYHEMTIFGFGRKGFKELVKHIPDLKQRPAKYSFGFIAQADHPTAKKWVDEVLAFEAKK